MPKMTKMDMIHQYHDHAVIDHRFNPEFIQYKDTGVIAVKIRPDKSVIKEFSTDLDMYEDMDRDKDPDADYVKFVTFDEKTIQAIQDSRDGKMVTFDSFDEMMKEIIEETPSETL